jgi:hypothetical protein
MEQGYYYKSGKLVTIDGIHSNTIGNIKDAIDNGYVRIRDHGNIVAFQGRSMELVKKAIKLFKSTIRHPKTIAQEWPGHYSVINN